MSKVINKKKKAKDTKLDIKSSIYKCQISQDEELATIESIYSIYGDYNKLDDDDYNSISVIVRPESNPDNNDKLLVTLVVRLPIGYPTTDIPKIEISNFTGLRMNEVKELLNLLNDLSKSRKGEQHIFELLTFCQEYLISKNNTKPTAIIVNSKKSLHDSMQDEKVRLQKEQDLKLKQDEANKAMQSLADLKKKEEENKLSRLDLNYESQLRDKWIEDNKSSDITSNVTKVAELQYMPVSLPPISINTSSLNAKSRYLNDFHEIKILGKGSFGLVTLCQNRIDGRLYALKRIALSHQSQDLHKILREVTALSRLHHQHVLRYFACWIEGVDETESNFENDEIRNLEKQLSDNWLENSNLDDLGVSIRSDSLFERNSYSMDQYNSSNNELTEKDKTLQLLNNNNLDDLLMESSPLFNPAEPSMGMDAGMYSYGKSLGAGHLKSDISFKSPYIRSQVPKGSQPPKIIVKSTSEKKKNDPIYLFIQTGFCEKSLYAAIQDEAQNINSQVAWKRFRQIIEGLGHIHQQGIIHRDLKPGNIFIESVTADIKIGDFGLATFDGVQAASSLQPGTPPDSLSLSNISSMSSIKNSFSYSNPSVISSEVAESDTDMTTGIGTHFYMSPEQQRSYTYSRYDVKTDVYSLGIIFFEMWHFFKTKMERSYVLKSLRNDLVFPKGFEEAHPRQCKLIRWMLDPEPSKRPTVAQLLDCDLLPPKIEDDYLKDALRIFSNPSTAFYNRMLDSIFKNSPSPPWMLDNYFRGSTLGRLPSSVNHFESEIFGTQCKNFISTLLQNLLAQHGAIFMSTPLMMPGKMPLESSCPVGSVSMLDRMGSCVSMRNDLRVGFSHFVCSQLCQKTDFDLTSTFSFTRMEIGPIFRPTPGGVSYREFVQADFDIVHSDALFSDIEIAATLGLGNAKIARICKEAEAIVIMTELIRSLSTYLPKGSSFARVRINHSKISCFMLSMLEITDAQKKCDAKEVFVQSSINWTSFRQSLASIGVSISVMDKLFEYWAVKQLSLSTAISKFTEIFPSNILQELIYLFEILEQFSDLSSSVETNSPSLSPIKSSDKERIFHINNVSIIFDPFLTFPESISSQFNGGVVWRCEANNGEVIAVGGRYDMYMDSILKMYTKEKSQHTLSSIGISFAVEKLVSFVMKGEHESELAQRKLNQQGFGSHDASLVYNLQSPYVAQREKTPTVFIVTIGDLWSEKLKLINEAWREGVCVDFLPCNASSTVQMEYASQRYANFVLLMNSKDKDKYKIKNLDKRTEMDIPKKELSKFFATISNNKRK